MPKKASFAVVSISVFRVLVWMIGQNVSKSMRVRIKPNECGQMTTKRNAIVIENILLRFS